MLKFRYNLSQFFLEQNQDKVQYEIISILHHIRDVAFSMNDRY